MHHTSCIGDCIPMKSPSVSNYYILDGKTTVAATLREWTRWMEANHNKRRVAQDTVDRYWISTVFLGLNHSWGDGPPLLFETLVFDRAETKVIEWPGGRVREFHPNIEDYGRRWHTWEEAEAGHAKVVRQMKAKTMGLVRIK